ncbi:MAG TPA: tetratricopeptide repeat protein [Bryobacteraceae bacterium]|nr:tetratricopeptide repeat protein [Bryobacteraceae bacterium]
MILRALITLAAVRLAFAQAPDPAYESLTRAYESLRVRSYDDAISNFQKAIELAPRRASIRKDLAYTYLKIGENELARDQFRAAMKIDPADTQVALEFAFLAYETKQQAQARRIFDRIRKTTGPSAATAEQAFQNIDAPLAAGIERWANAIALGADNFSAHFELATLAEQRDQLPLAAEHYEKAWRLLPDRRAVLVDLGRVWLAMGREEDATAALLAASRGGEPHAAEMARELLPGRYPYVSEFEAALQLDPANVELRRELAYLLLRMDRQGQAEDQFRSLTDTAPDDLLSTTQLGFLLWSRGEHDAAMPLFERVLANQDNELANRVRAVLHLPQVLSARPDSPSASIDAKVMAEHSIQAGYMKDALKYLQIAHEADPGDFDIMLKLGWTFNILHQDRQAIRWFDLARRSPDPRVAAEARKAWRNLHGAYERFQTSVWFYPIFSSRWRDLFAYGQVKTEVRTGRFIQPYLSVRFIGDTRESIGFFPVYLSESSFIVGAGVRTLPWHNVTSWFEAGSAMSYATGHLLPDYRGGISARWARLPEASGWFIDNTGDGVFMSRFSNDFLFFSESRLGYAIGRHIQLYGNFNLRVDAQRQPWANFFEIGPGVRVSPRWLPRSMWIACDVLRGSYQINSDVPGRPSFHDIRIGAWYAFSTH